MISLLLAVSFYGLKFDPASTNAPSTASIYPVAPNVYRMVQPDNQVRYFDLTDAKTGVLTGPRPWLGVIKNQQIDIWADPTLTGRKLRTAFTFVSGRLRFMVLDGKRYVFAKGEPRENDMKALYPERRTRTYAKNSAADLWKNDSGRLRLWFASPNAAGLFLAELALLALFIAIRMKGWWRIVPAVVFLGTAYGMFATASRSALVGFMLGLLCLGAAYLRLLFTKRGLLAIGIAVLMIAVGIYFSGDAGRIFNTFRQIDDGNALRIKVAKAALQMFADAPFGWSGGEVPGRNACLNWYVFDSAHSLRTHFMSLAECGWFKGFVYVLFWMVLAITGIVGAFRRNPLPGVLWVAFGAAGFFNPVYIDWETWVLPVLSLVCWLAPSNRQPARLLMLEGAASVVLTTVFIVAMIVIGNLFTRPTSVTVKSSGEATFVNGDDPRIWVVGDPLVMGGMGFPGREILSYYERNPKAEPIAYVYDVGALPKSAELVVVAGRNVPDFLEAFAAGRACKAKRLLLFSPSVGPGAVKNELLKASETAWVAGSLMASRDASYGKHQPWVVMVPGCERYIPDWVAMIHRMRKIGK